MAGRDVAAYAKSVFSTQFSVTFTFLFFQHSRLLSSKKKRELATQFSFLCMSSTVSGSNSWGFALRMKLAISMPTQPNLQAILPSSSSSTFFFFCLLPNYRKRGSASYIVREVLSVRERERERDGSDVTIVALKLAMNLHFPLPKIRTIGDELTYIIGASLKRAPQLRVDLAFCHDIL